MMGPGISRVRLPRDGGSGRPYPDAKVAAVRALVETTDLAPAEIARRTGVCVATVYRWTAAGGFGRRGGPDLTREPPKEIDRDDPDLGGRSPRMRAIRRAETILGWLDRTGEADLAAIGRALDALDEARAVRGRPRGRAAGR